jgi:acetylornithine/succinyldiaminopimelate/putrescine aminotransferase
MGQMWRASLIEPVIGEAAPIPPSLSRGRLQITNQFNTSLIDGLKTGMGPHRRRLGQQHDGVVADAISLAKGPHGGYIRRARPIKGSGGRCHAGARTARRSVATRWPARRRAS